MQKKKYFFGVNYIFLRKKGDFSDVFSAFYDQRLVTAAWATRSPWSIISCKDYYRTSRISTNKNVRGFVDLTSTAAEIYCWLGTLDLLTLTPTTPDIYHDRNVSPHRHREEQQQRQLVLLGTRVGSGFRDRTLAVKNRKINFKSE